MSQKKVRFDQFELDYGRFLLCRCGTPVRLEDLPLKLLMFLIENQQTMVTREQIAERLWGKDVFIDAEQGINTAIRKIRIALQDDFVQPRFVKTVVGRGYCFVGEAVTQEGHGDEASGADQVMFSAEELGRAVMAAAGLDPTDPKGQRKGPSED
jgi:DNA-binding winged helix-turn-helix (wHTH) protein